eukprot:1157407-Pelagomonas_calceolata.AAC.11
MGLFLLAWLTQPGTYFNRINSKDSHGSSFGCFRVSLVTASQEPEDFELHFCEMAAQANVPVSRVAPHECVSKQASLSTR